MKKKSFISLYVLLTLLIISISVSYIYKQGQNNSSYNEDLYNKKTALYKAESVANIFYQDKDTIKSSIDYLDTRKINDNWADEDNKITNQVLYDNENIDIELIKLKKTNKYFQNNDDKNYYKIRANSVCNTSIATSEIIIRKNFAYDIYKNEPIKMTEEEIIDFLNLLDFKEIKLKNQDKKLIKLGQGENFLRVNNTLLVKNRPKKIKEKASSLSSKKNQRKRENHLTSAKFSGILVVDNDLILDRDFQIKGLLIVKGEIKRKNDHVFLNIDGQIISSKDIDENFIKVNYNKDVNKYIKDIKNPYKLETIVKKTY